MCVCFGARRCAGGCALSFLGWRSQFSAGNAAKNRRRGLIGPTQTRPDILWAPRLQKNGKKVETVSDVAAGISSTEKPESPLVRKLCVSANAGRSTPNLCKQCNTADPLIYYTSKFVLKFDLTTSKIDLETLIVLP
jgi:hypothetical protein